MNAVAVEPLFTWEPNPGPQTRFLACGAYEALYGGAAGGGKSEVLIVDPLRSVGFSSFRALLLRRTYPELERSLIDRSRQLYPAVAPGAAYNSQDKCWRFPSGARIYFGHAEHEHSVHQYQGAEFQYLGFDELTHFLEKQYTYLLSRVRSASGMPVYVRGATNPGGDGHEWVMKRWAPWLDQESKIRGEAGKALYYVNGEEGETWCDRASEGALSRVFIPAKVEDNPHLTQNDPGYRQRLMGLDRVTRAQLLDGNWLARPAAGAYFKRSWFEVVDVSPAKAYRVRYWDRAATKDGDWTVGVKVARTIEGALYVEHVERLRGTPAEVEAAIKRTASAEPDVQIGIEQDPGQAGVFEAKYYVRALQGFNVRLTKPTGDKVTRAQPISAQCEGGNVRLVRGPWIDKFLAELEEFPEGAHDDQVDAFSGAFAQLGGAAPGFEDHYGGSRRRA